MGAVLLREHSVSGGPAVVDEHDVHGAVANVALREHEYNPALMRLHVLGGGSCLIRNFGQYDADRVTIYDDICGTAAPG